MRFRLWRPFDHVPAVGLAGILASMTLDKWSQVAAISAAFAATGYTLTKWFLLIRINARKAVLDTLPPFPEPKRENPSPDL